MKPKFTALYCRLSQEDEKLGESVSIQHQKEFLSDYATRHNYLNQKFYIDDGISGTTMDRPELQRLMADVNKGMVDVILVKDLSRLGRNYLSVGFLLEDFSHNKKVHIIAVQDGYDSDIPESADFVPFHNLMNEFYAREISKKERAVIHSKGNRGIPITMRIPYGYKKGENGEWLIDEPAAEVVRLIFQLFLDGNGVQIIANELYARKILAPSVYLGKVKKGTAVETNPYLWSQRTIAGILDRQEYCGDTVNFRTERASFKSKQIIRHDPSEFKIFPDTHEAIIDRDTFEQARERREKRYRVSPIEEPALFTQYLRCADCGNRMHVMRSRNYKVQKPDCYVCAGYRKKVKNCTSHYVPERYLIQVVLEAIQKVHRAVTSHSTELKKQLIDETVRQAKRTISENEETIAKMEKRETLLQEALANLYIDKLKNGIDDAAFQEISYSITSELQKIRDTTAQLSEENAEMRSENTRADLLFDVIQKYDAIDTLTPQVMHDFIDHIDVHEGVKIPGKRARLREVDIYFVGVGKIDLSEL